MRLAHDRTGSGPPLVLVHGIGSRRGVWEPLLEALAAEREVVCVDLPGFGESPPLPGGTRPDPPGLARAVAAFARELGLERPHAGGNSLGGAVALEMARQGAARTVAALSPAGFATGALRTYAHNSLRFSRRFAQLAAPAAEALSRSAARRTLVHSQMRGRPARLAPAASAADLRGLARAPGFAATLAELDRYEILDDGGVDVPVTIAWGGRDRLLPPRLAARARAALPRARHLTLPGCGHLPMADDPALVARVLLEASAEPAARAAGAATAEPAR